MLRINVVTEKKIEAINITKLKSNRKLYTLQYYYFASLQFFDSPSFHKLKMFSIYVSLELATSNDLTTFPTELPHLFCKIHGSENILNS